MDDTLTVDAMADFTVGDEITIFSPTASVNSKVNAKTGTTLTIPDLNTGFRAVLRHEAQERQRDAQCRDESIDGRLRFEHRRE